MGCIGGGGSEVDPPHLIAVGIDGACCNFQREPCLAHPADTHQCDQPGAAQTVPDGSQFVGPTHQLLVDRREGGLLGGGAGEELAHHRQARPDDRVHLVGCGEIGERDRTDGAEVEALG